MSSLNSLYIKADVLKVLLDAVTRKGEKGIELTVNLSDEENQYGQNVSAWVSQSKEQREAKKERYFVGNGKTFWKSDGGVVKSKPEESKGINSEDDDLPF